MTMHEKEYKESKESVTEAPQAVYYQPPASHESHLKKMMLYLAITFTSLFVIAALFVFYADQILVNLPFSAEKKFVKPYEDVTRYFADGEASSERETIELYLDNLTLKIANTMDLPADMQIDVHYIDTDSINAFATLGGHVFICRGLMDALSDENSLTMVIGHEIAHVKNRDPIVGMARGVTIQMLYSYFTGDYSNLNVSGLGSELGLSYFSREQERKADELGIAALHAHYGHVAGFDSLFNALQEEAEKDNKSDQANWFSSHPDLEERIASLSEQAAMNNWHIGEVKAYPENIIEALTKMQEKSKTTKGF